MSNNWTEGYVTEVPYTHGYYRELSPSLQRFALLSRGFAPPADGPYLELGFGQGLSACIHAAASGCLVWATDFNPTQAAYAQSLSRAAGLDVKFLDDSFEQLLARNDLPEFQYIGAHGIWTWVSNDARKQIVELLRSKLSVGGMAYLSYNSFPGWSAAYSLRHLLVLQADVMGSAAQGVLERVTNALDFANDLVAKNALYFKTNPMLGERLQKMTGFDKHYLAHEYFNRNWQPMHFSEVVEWLTPAKLEFVTSVHMLDHVDIINLSTEALQTLQAIKQKVFRESVRDYFVNQQFRRDIFVRGPLQLSALDQREALMQSAVALLVTPEEISYTVTGVNEVTLQETIYRPIIELFAQRNYRPHTLAELAKEFPGLVWDQLIQVVTILIGAGHMHPVQTEAVIKKATPKAKALNKELCLRARSSSDISYLASPVIGAGIIVNRFEQLFLASKQAGKSQPQAWVEDAWSILQLQGQKLVVDGKTMETTEENIAALGKYLEKFTARLPILTALGIA